MADDIKELTFHNNFYDADNMVNGSYDGDVVIDFTTNKLLSGYISLDGYRVDTTDSFRFPLGLSQNDSGQYVLFGRPAGLTSYDSVTFTGSSPTVIDSASYNYTVSAHQEYGNSTDGTPPDERPITATGLVAPTVTFATVSYTDTGTPADGLTSNPAVVLSGSETDATSVEVYDGLTDLGPATITASGTWSLSASLADSPHDGFSAVATGGPGMLEATATNATSVTVDTIAPSVAFDRTTAGFKSGIRPVLAGTVSDANGVAGVEIYDGDTDLGAATVGPSGHWTFTDNLGSGDYANLTAVATAASGTTASTAAPYELVTGVVGTPYRALEYDYAADGSYGYKAFGPTGTALVTATDNENGTHTIRSIANGQDLYSARNDVMTGGGNNETFVFFPNFGHDEVTDFNVSGGGHDVVDLSNTQLHTLAQVLNHTTMAGGSATLHLYGTGTVTLDGVTKAQLKAHPGDILFA